MNRLLQGTMFDSKVKQITHLLPFLVPQIPHRSHPLEKTLARALWLQQNLFGFQALFQAGERTGTSMRKSCAALKTS